ncbi:hypothetical protein CI109_102738 [Kwoniella shandongensis]|uniref:Uncharacterized protein n=1 Tax=Kwoniella shandongensis TaxID=1734106 RepID=A0A5M6BV42_9TREE|nr:uncharacterized protein CI109_004939 [Kwoniella shandongensis]KAA5526736.1 hypothetical protein CI109_004939 [Kwoniella shandongensis]
MEQIITSEPRLKGSLPSDFLWGAASASYQIEGGYDADGKGPSVYDVLWKDQANGEIACDSYHLWREDIAVLKKYGMKAYRFSINWPRVITLGGANDPINEKGLEYYSTLIDALIEADIEPIVTIYHWELPYALYERYQGFYSKKEMLPDFLRYAELLFERFGARVKNWITINEPHIITTAACHLYKGKWNPETDIPRWAESMLLCHGATVDLYRRKFQTRQGGKIGITLDIDWTEPIDDSSEARHAHETWMGHVARLYADPIFYGRFPDSLMEYYGEHAPSFTEEEWKLVKGSTDFLGLNHYGTSWVTGEQWTLGEAPRMESCSGRVKRVFVKDGVVIGNRGNNGHPHDVPWGFRKLILWLHTNYTKSAQIPLMVTENGFSVDGEIDLTFEEKIHDVQRQHYYAGYIKEMLEAMVDQGVEMSGYFAWSLLDNLEWTSGWVPRFGITVVDRENDFARYPKDSAYMLGRIFRYASGQTELSESSQ